MQTPVVVMVNKISYEPLCIRQRQWRVYSNAIAFNRSVIALQLAVALWIIRRGFYMCHTADFDKLLKIFCDKLRAVVGDDSGFGIGEFFMCSL